MWKSIWIKPSGLLFILVFSCLFYSHVGTCSASRTYQISETELTTLQNHLDALKSNNEALLIALNESGADLGTASNALSASKRELQMLKEQLKALQDETKSLSESLRIANDALQSARESFRKSEQERDRIEGRLRTQRNVWEALFAVAVGVAVAR